MSISMTMNRSESLPSYCFVKNVPPDPPPEGVAWAARRD